MMVFPVRVLLAAAAAALAQLTGAACAVTVEVLPDPAWRLINANGSIDVPAAVPGCVTDALMRAGLVGDPLWRYNEVHHKWVVHEPVWTLHGTVMVEERVLRHTTHELLFDGLDTLADVTWNGEHVLSARNFHRSHRVKVTGRVSPGRNNLTIQLRSAVTNVYAAAQTYPYAVPSNPSPRAYLHYNFLRKPASDFGWDWGPAVVPAGVHGPIKLLAYSQPYVSGVHVIRQSHSASVITLELEAAVVGPNTPPPSPGIHSTLTARLPALPGVTATEPLTRLTPGVQHVRLNLSVPVAAVRLWWPAGLGAQPLYWIEVAVQGGTPAGPQLAGAYKLRDGSRQQDSDTPASGTAPRTAAHVRVGFRTVELVRQPLDAAWKDIAAHFLAPGTSPSSSGNGNNGSGNRNDSNRTDNRNGSNDSNDQGYNDSESGNGHGGGAGGSPSGESFYFRVNGVPVYTRGANLIPIDVLHTRAGPEAARTLVRQAADAGMNMLRVWGGGRYQIDAFYEECDARGILVWQELMYACAPYPMDPVLLQEAAQEAREVVRRLAAHPSIAIWGANNEVESSFLEYETVQDNLALYAADFHAWFIDNLAPIVQELDPGRPYVDTSPSNGLFRSTPPLVKRWGDPQDPRYGDVHYYNYRDDCMDVDHLPAAKFVSETGWQSAPSWAAISGVTLPEDWDPWSPAMQFRQRHPDGDAQLLRQLCRHFALPNGWCEARREGEAPQPTKTPAAPPTASTPPASFLTWIRLTQAQQALCMAAAADHWRRLSTDPAALSMGLLYWQLNDIWAGYSWSGLDHPASPGAAPRWKPLHYAMARAFAPLAVLAAVHDAQVQVHLASSVTLSLQAEVVVRLVRLAVTNRSDCAIAAPALARRQVRLAPLRMLPDVWSARLEELLPGGPDGCTATTCLVSVDVEWQAEEGPQHAWWNSYIQHMAGATISPSGSHRTAEAAAPGVFVTSKQVWFASFKELEGGGGDGGTEAALRFSDWALRGDGAVCFTVAAAWLLPGLVLEVGLPLQGRFTDNFLTLDPCLPRHLCFVPDDGVHADISALQTALTASSLVEYMGHATLDMFRHPNGLSAST